MKKIFTFFALTSLILLTNLNLSAQTTRRLDSSRSKLTKATRIDSAEAFSDGDGVWLRWKTSSETNNLGFNIYRIDGEQIVSISSQIIPSRGLQMPNPYVSDGEYTFFDANGNLSGKYFIETVALDGAKKSFNVFQPLQVDDLTPFAGSSSDFLKKAKADAQPEVNISELVIPQDLQLEMKAESAGIEADLNLQKWVAAQSGVKIGVKSEGVYRVSRAQLEAAGFNVNSSPTLWQLYKNGVEQPMLVAPNGDFVEFYGRGIDTYETDTQIYFLVAGTNGGKRMRSRTGRTIGGNVVATNYIQTSEKRERSFYYSGTLNGDAENFFGSVINNGGTNINFTLTGVESSPNVEVSITLQGLGVTSHVVRALLNGTEIGTVQGISTSSMTKTFNVSSELLREGANTLRLTAQASGDNSLFNNIKITYPRRYLARENELSFYTDNYLTTTVTGFTSPNIRVFDITSPESPVLMNNLKINQVGGSYSVKLPAYRGRVFYAVADTAVKTPSSITQNTASEISNVSNSADLLIVTHKNFQAQAGDWANYRIGQGVSVKIIDVEDIFDEFSYGNITALALRDFFRHAKTSWQTPPKYVLLMGDATYDPRNYEGRGNWNLVPTKMFDTLYTETGSDEFLTDFNNDGLAEIPIGRVPARSTDNATLALNKVKTFEQNLNTATGRGALCVSDLPIGYDFSAVCNRVFNELSPNFNKSFINRGDTDAATNLLTALNSGKYIVNYSGHGSSFAWSSDSNFFNGTKAGQLTNNDLTVFTMLTCLNGYFVDTANPSFSEHALFGSRGAVAAWASTGLTTPDIQEVMAKRFYKSLSEGNITHIGDLINDAKTAIPFGRDVRLSWALLGDPMLKIR